MLACQLPDLSGIDVMIAIRQEFPQARVVMLTTFEGDVEIQRAFDATTPDKAYSRRPERPT